MSMKRRGFLKMFGGAVAAPLMPSVSFAAATKAAYPASALHAAIYHAQTRVNFSAFALAHKLNLQIPQAEALMADMSARGILGPLQGKTQSGRWALSKVWNRPFVDAAAGQSAARAKAKQAKAESAKAQRAKASGEQQTGTHQKAEMRESGANLNPLLAHLRKMAQDHGLKLHARCFAATDQYQTHINSIQKMAH